MNQIDRTYLVIGLVALVLIGLFDGMFESVIAGLFLAATIGYSGKMYLIQENKDEKGG